LFDPNLPTPLQFRQMDARPKVTKEVLCEESRFILANVLAEARYGRQNHYEDIRRVCEEAVTIPFAEYINFLDAAGYMRHDHAAGRLVVTPRGEEIVNGGSLTELTQAAVAHFKNVRSRRRQENSAEPDVGLVTAAASSASLRRGEGPPPAVSGSTGRGALRQQSSDLIDLRYEKLGPLGSGGIGTVYQARQVPLGRLVALKEIRELFALFADDQHAEIVRRFTEIVRQAAGLAHPNIMPIHDVNLESGHPYVVSELAPNGSARRLIQDAESIPVALSLKFLLQTLHALRAAHKLGVYHRGLKPENMLIDAYGNVKVSDFGMARIVERDTSVIRQVYVGMGAVAYMAPELFTDPTNADAQADIYAVGIIFYELLTRKLPGRRSPLPSEIEPRLPKGLDDIFDTMTRDARSERYSKVDDILEDFDKIDGLHEVLGAHSQVLVEENPLSAIKFRTPPPPAPIANPAPAATAGASATPAAPETAKLPGTTAASSSTSITTTSPVAPSPTVPPTSVAAASEPNLDDEDRTAGGLPAAPGDGDDDDKAKRRPYSFQQRQPKK
jgi:serine/threonine protein kinase